MVGRDLDGEMHQPQAKAFFDPSPDRRQPAVRQQRMPLSAVGEEHDRVRLRQDVVTEVTIRHDADREIGDVGEAARQQVHAGKELMLAGRMGRSAGDEGEPPRHDALTGMSPAGSADGPRNASRRKARPSMASWSGDSASGRQIAAARAIASLWGVNDSMQTGPA